MTARNFLRRTCGNWTSERRYLFAPKFAPVNMTTKFSITELTGDVFQVVWEGNTSGTMELTLDGNTLHRSRNYFGEGANNSAIEVIDQDCIVLRTEYDNTRFREEIRFVEEDMFRLRQTVGYNVETGQLVLAGQYFESRI